MRAVTLRFADEVRTPKDVGLPAPQETDKKRVSAMKKLITSHAKASLVDAEMKEIEEDDVMRVAEKKLKQGEDVVEVPKEAREEETAEEGEVVDLMAKIRERLREAPAKAKTPRRTKAKRAGASKTRKPATRRRASTARR
ncbi:MAG: hypothetical protein HOV80_39660 [Polyangiaceae bacterium]|nr:hypothetical protein [Polyangiaceae bacterium]